MLKALTSKWVQSQVKATSDKKSALVAQRRIPVVGASVYPNATEKPLKATHIARVEFLSERLRRVNRLKALRDINEVRRAIAGIDLSLEDNSYNLLDASIRAAAAGATINEITASITVPGDHSPNVEALRGKRLAAPFEELRQNARVYENEHGKAPSAYMIPMGPLAFRRARADFVIGFLGAGGIQCEEPSAFKTTEEAIEAVTSVDQKLFVVCSDDPSYPEIVPPIAKAIKAAKKNAVVYVAGYPADAIDSLKESGVDGFIHIKANAIDTLNEIQSKLEISDVKVGA